MVDIVEVDFTQDSTSVLNEVTTTNSSSNDSHSETKDTFYSNKEEEAVHGRGGTRVEKCSTFFSDSSSSESLHKYPDNFSHSSSSRSSSCSSKLEGSQCQTDYKPPPRCINIKAHRETANRDTKGSNQASQLLYQERGQKDQNSNQVEGEKTRNDDLSFASCAGGSRKSAGQRIFDDDDEDYYEDEKIIFSPFDDGSVGRSNFSNEKSTDNSIDHSSNSKNDSLREENIYGKQRHKACVDSISTTYRRSDSAGNNDGDESHDRDSSGMMVENRAHTAHEKTRENDMKRDYNDILSSSPSKAFYARNGETYDNLKMQLNKMGKKEKSVNKSVKTIPSNPYLKKAKETSTPQRDNHMISSSKEGIRNQTKKSNSLPLSQFYSLQKIYNDGCTGETTSHKQNNVEIQKGAAFSSASSLFFAQIENGDFDSSTQTFLTQTARHQNNKRNVSPSISHKGDEIKRGKYFHNGKLDVSLPPHVKRYENQANDLQVEGDIKKMDKGSNEQEIVAERQKSPLLIDPRLYQPVAHVSKPDPIVHAFTSKNCPSDARRMVPISSLFPPPMSKLWECRFHSFNHVQSQMAQKIVNSHSNIVVSAPTGAGKTCIFELAMAKLLTSERSKYDNHNNGVNSISNASKIVYLSPSKALCEERYDDWGKRFSTVEKSIQIVMVTGDSDTMSMQRIASAHIILTTPEKWDGITRRWTNHLFLIGSIKLLLIDEVHLLGDESRGGCLEAVLCRMKTVQRARHKTCAPMYVSQPFD